MPQFDSFNPILTSSPLLIALVCSFYKKVVTPLSSKSCNYPKKLRLHQPPSLTCSHNSTTHESLAMTKNNVEEDSYQKQVSIPSIFPKFDSSSIANHEMRSILEWLSPISNHPPHTHHPITIPHTVTPLSTISILLPQAFVL